MSENRALLAAAWMAGAIVSFTAMAVGGRELIADLDTFEILAYRSLIGIVVIGALVRPLGWREQVRARRMPLHLLRNAVHFAGQNLWFFAIGVAPLAQVIALEFTAPLWVALLAPLLLGERLTRMGLFAACLGFVGTLIIAQPSIDHVPPGVLAALGAAVFFAGSAILTKILTRTESVISILFWLTLMQAAFGLICAGIDGRMTLPTWAMAPWLLVVGLTGLSAHFCLTRALSIAPASVVMPLDFARLPVVGLVGVLLYDEPLGLALVVGAAIILGANWINIALAAPRTTRGVSAR